MKKLISLFVLIFFIFGLYFLYQKSLINKRIGDRTKASLIINNELKTLWDWLNVYINFNWKSLPIPENKIDVKINNVLVWYQWYIWSEIIKEIWFDENFLKDSFTNQYYTYFLTVDWKFFQLMWHTLWNIILDNDYSIFDYLIAVFTFNDSNNKFDILVYWNKLWIITDKNNLPIQDTLGEKYFDYGNFLDEYKVYFKGDEFINWKIDNIDLLKESLEKWWRWFSVVDWKLIHNK